MAGGGSRGASHAPGPIDLTGTYTLISGVDVVPRSGDAVQIGAEPPRWLILHQAPAQSLQILRRLDGSARLGDVLAEHDADPLVWLGLLTRLRDHGLLVAVADWSFPGTTQDVLLETERNSLVYRHGMDTARRLLLRRQEALVVVRGSGRVATAVAGLLAASGVGHVYQEPDRAVRSADLSALAYPGPAAPVRTAAMRPDPSSRPDPNSRPDPYLRPDPTSRPDPISGPQPGSGPDLGAPDSPRRFGGDPPPRRPDPARPKRGNDAAVLAAQLRRISRSVRTHPPAAHQHPSLVVLASDYATAPWAASDLLRNHIPHIAVRAQLTSAVVGPLVLPGRSACLLCVLRHRGDVDPGWPAFEAAMAQAPTSSPAALVWTAATLATVDALTHLDGVAVPTTVDGTVEWWAGEFAPRRRSWSHHPECGCLQTARRAEEAPMRPEPSAGWSTME